MNFQLHALAVGALLAAATANVGAQNSANPFVSPLSQGNSSSGGEGGSAGSAGRGAEVPSVGGRSDGPRGGVGSFAPPGREAPARVVREVEPGDLPTGDGRSGFGMRVTLIAGDRATLKTAIGNIPVKDGEVIALPEGRVRVDVDEAAQRVRLIDREDNAVLWQSGVASPGEEDPRLEALAEDRSVSHAILVRPLEDFISRGNAIGGTTRNSNDSGNSSNTNR